MKLQAEIHANKHEVEIKRDARNVVATVDDRSYQLDVSEPEPGVFLISHEGRIYEAVVTPPARVGDSTHVRIGSTETEIKLIDPKRLRSSSAGAEHGDGIAEIRTAMPGKIVRVLLKAGDEVEVGGSVLVVEAMKMQNELKSPKAGRVKDIRVQEGDAVSAGDILATVE